MKLSNIPLESNTNNKGALTLYTFLEFNNLNLRTNFVNLGEDGIHIMSVIPMGLAHPEPIQPLGHPSKSTKAKSDVGSLLQSSVTFTNCTFVLTK